MDLPAMPQKTPYVEKLDAGVYAWCSCGLSTKQPYCDGSHKGTGFAPTIEKLEEAKTVAWCGCKKSDGKPYCDGTHARL